MNINNLRNYLYYTKYFVNETRNKDNLIRDILVNNVHEPISNKMINIPVHGSSGAPCRSGRIQLTGTCWFQSILNPFLLSDVGRSLLSAKLAEFKSRNDVKKWTNIQACPYKLEGAFFWSYIEYKLKEDYTNINTYKNVMKGRLYENNRLIHNLYLRNANKSTQGGDHADLYEFLMQVFPNDSISFRGTPTRHMKNNLAYVRPVKPHYAPLVASCLYHFIPDDGTFAPLKTFNFNGCEYRLFGAQIFSWGSTQGGRLIGHAMTGYLCGNGKYMFYDSNNIRTTAQDWTSKKFWSTWLKNYSAKYFPSSSKLPDCQFLYVRVGPRPVQK